MIADPGRWGKTVGSQVLRPLARCLSDPSADVRVEVVRALLAIENARTLPWLREICEQDPDQRVREAAREAFWWISIRHGQPFDESEALRVASRKDPDVILVGELRDLETITMALQAAVTGILVLATLHTNSPSRTVARLINVFPASEQDAIRTLLACVLRGILSQQLLPRHTGGRVPAIEILFLDRGPSEHDP